MKFFDKKEIIAVLVILFLVFAASYPNMKAALRRARDAERRDLLGGLYTGFERYYSDFGFFPPSSPDGRIVACKGENFESKVKELKGADRLDLDKFFSALSPCDWGVDPLRDVLDDSYADYIKTLPKDPRASEGISFNYQSNGKRFQIYTYLEGEEDEEYYDPGIVERRLSCGVKICNFGRGYGATPLDKSLEEYENELLLKTRK